MVVIKNNIVCLCVDTLSPCKNDLAVKNVECEMRFSFPNSKRIADKVERLDEIETDHHEGEARDAAAAGIFSLGRACSNSFL